jgi:hypothetical protein
MELLQGFPPGWTIPFPVFEEGEDLDSHRYHALGNAVSVPVISWLAERITLTQGVSHIQPKLVAELPAPEARASNREMSA